MAKAKSDFYKRLVGGLAGATIAITAASMLGSSRRSQTKRDEEEVYDSELGEMFPKTLYNSGIKGLDKKTALTLRGIFYALRNHREGRQVGRYGLGTPQAGIYDGSKVLVNYGPDAGVYSPDQAWLDSETSRGMHAEVMKRDLTKLSIADYDKLSPQLKMIVDEARKILETEQSNKNPENLESRV